MLDIRSLNTMKTIGLINLDPAVNRSYYLMMSLSTSRKKVSLGRALLELHQDYPNYHNEFGHLEADTIQGKKHRGAVMTLVERKSKAVIILNTRHKTDKAIFEKLDAFTFCYS